MRRLQIAALALPLLLVGIAATPLLPAGDKWVNFFERQDFAPPPPANSSRPTD